MFLGVNKLNLDTKGRLAIPVKYRERLMGNGASAIVVTINPRKDVCGCIRKLNGNRLHRRYLACPRLNLRTANCSVCCWGMHPNLKWMAGTVLLNNELREYAGMDKRVALAGLGHKFELWSEESWTDGRKDWLEEAIQPDSDLSEELQNLAL